MHTKIPPNPRYFEGIPEYTISHLYQASPCTHRCGTLQRNAMLNDAIHVGTVSWRIDGPRGLGDIPQACPRESMSLTASHNLWLFFSLLLLFSNCNVDFFSILVLHDSWWKSDHTPTTKNWVRSEWTHSIENKKINSNRKSCTSWFRRRVHSFPTWCEYQIHFHIAIFLNLLLKLLSPLRFGIRCHLVTPILMSNQTPSTHVEYTFFPIQSGPC